MFTLRVARYDRPELLLAECHSAVVPVAGEMLLLDAVNGEGAPDGPSTCWRVVAVTLHVPSVRSAPRTDGLPHTVEIVDVAVRPDSVGIPELSKSAQDILSESRM